LKSLAWPWRSGVSESAETSPCHTAAQKRWGYVCAAVGLGLAAAGITAIVGFATLDIEQARAIEKQMHASTEGEQ